MIYQFINYKGEVIYTEKTNHPDATERMLLNAGFQVGGYQIA